MPPKDATISDFGDLDDFTCAVIDQFARAYSMAAAQCVGHREPRIGLTLPGVNPKRGAPARMASAMKDGAR
jgi:hypothetical protein